MCMFGKPAMPKQNDPPPPPPPIPPAPQETAQGLTVGDQRQGAPAIKNFLKRSLGANKSSLIVPIGGTDPAGTGLNIPPR